MKIVDKIQIEIQNIKNEKQFIEMYTKKFQNHELDEIEIRGIALTTSAIYNGIEKVLKFLLESKGIAITKNDSWHLQLLKVSMEHTFISQDMFTELKSFLSFRHFVRHAYTFELNKEFIDSIIQKVPNLTDSFIEEINKNINN